MRTTKNDKARVIIQALHNLDNLPSSDHKEVKREARANMAALNDRYKLAVKVLQQRIDAGQNWEGLNNEC